MEIGILAYEGAQLAATLGLRDLLDTAGSLAAERSGQLRLTARVLEITDLSAEPVNLLTALILPPSLSRSRPKPLSPALAGWIKARYSEGTLLCSVCAGAFLLADLGLLDGRRATTHWAFSEVFAAQYPQVRLDTDRLLIDDGDLITAGGLMAWTDVGLRLVSRYLGPVDQRQLFLPVGDNYFCRWGPAGSAWHAGGEGASAWSRTDKYGC